MSAVASEFYKRKWQEQFPRAEAAEKLVKHWQREHEAKLKSLHADVQREMIGAIRQKAMVALARGGDKPVLRFTEREFEELMRAFVCQERRHRHGPVEHFSQDQIKTQIDALCEQYGWTWVEAAKAQKEMPKGGEAGG